jgi:hypothetical protein
VSVVGHDDSPAAAAAIVPLTTVRRPVEEIAAAVVELLVTRLEDRDSETRVVRFSGTLVTRASTAACTGFETVTSTVTDEAKNRMRDAVVSSAPRGRRNIGDKEVHADRLRCPS